MLQGPKNTFFFENALKKLLLKGKQIKEKTKQSETKINLAIAEGSAK